MEIFTGDSRIIKREIEELLGFIKRTNTKSLLAYDNAETLISFYNCITKRDNDYFERLADNYYQVIEKKSKNLENKRIQNIIKNRESHENFVVHIQTSCKDILDSIEDKGKDYKLTFNNQEMYDILSDFFRKRNKTALEVFHSLIKDKRIYKLPNKEEFCDGYSLFNFYKNSFHLFIKDNENMLSLMTGIVHEIGHVMDDLQMNLSSKNRRKINCYTTQPLLVEGISMMYENEFNLFLMEEGILTEYAINESIMNLSSFYHFLEEAELLLYLPNELLEKEQYKDVSKDYFENYFKKYCPILIECDDDFNAQELDLVESLKCCYGTVLSKYFSYLRRQDKDNYRDTLRNFLTLRRNPFPPDLFERLGTTISDFSSIIQEDFSTIQDKIYVKK